MDGDSHSRTPLSIDHVQALLPRAASPAANGGAGVGGVQYLQLDLFADDFTATLRAHVESIGLPCYLLGMHLCGELSLRAIAAFEAIAGARALILVPCCLPNRALPSAPSALYASPLPDAQYNAWCEHLVSRCRLVPEATVEDWSEPHVASVKRRVIMATRLESNQ